MSEQSIEPEVVLPEGMFAQWDTDSRVYTELQADGSTISRPFTDEENAWTDAEINRAALVDKAKAGTAANLADIATNDAFLAIAAPTNAQLAAQVKELSRQSSRQARELNALARFALDRFESTTDVIA